MYLHDVVFQPHYSGYNATTLLLEKVCLTIALSRLRVVSGFVRPGLLSPFLPMDPLIVILYSLNPIKYFMCKS